MNPQHAAFRKGIPLLWCIAAKDAPIVAVLARFFMNERQTCILRWNWKTGTLEEGASSRLRILAHRCELSDDGEYFLYEASAGKDSLFSYEHHGAQAISRLPWLSALTCRTAESEHELLPTQHSLPLDEQNILWSLFDARNAHHGRYMLWGADKVNWVRITPTPHWSVKVEIGTPVEVRYAANIPDTRCRLLICVHGRTEFSWVPNFSTWGNHLTYIICSAEDDSVPGVVLKDVRWAYPAPGGRILVADQHANLKVLRLPRNAGMDARLKTVQQHSLAALRPRSEPSPAWARARLKRA